MSRSTSPLFLHLDSGAKLVGFSLAATRESPLKMPSSRFKLTTWIAFADFFTAISLFAFALFAVQRQKVLMIEKPVRDFARALFGELEKSGLRPEFDKERSRLTLPEAMLFQTGRWEIRSPERVKQLADALKQARAKLEAADSAAWSKTKSFHLVIRGHADARPIGGFSNLRLSQLRARALEESLLSNEISAPDFHVSSQGVGESEPAIDNCRPQRAKPRSACPDGKYASDNELAANRRIELRFGFFTGN